MTIPHLSQSAFLDLLKQHGYVQVSNQDWETHNRIMIGNGKDSFPFQLLDTYYYHHVVKLCSSLGIPAPEDCQKCYDQCQELKSRNKEKASEEEE